MFVKGCGVSALFLLTNIIMDETTAPSTVAAGGNAIGPERHVIAERYRLVMGLGRWNFCLMTRAVNEYPVAIPLQGALVAVWPRYCAI